MNERTAPATFDCDHQPQGSQPEPEEKIWFDGEWLDALLSCEKQQATLEQTDRIKVGDTVQIYNQNHTVILGKVVITEVYDITPSEMSGEELEAWAWANGFDNCEDARCWVEIRYGARWMHMTWTAICWRGWQERYFEPEEGAGL